ncbi:MAG: methylornithine synthase PylB [Lachnospiraceae bacterium]|nr:methylornithine synthase PylB [Lachnospiraceae bacterium]
MTEPLLRKEDGILEKCLREQEISDEEIDFLMTGDGSGDRDFYERIFETARSLRDKYFGNKVFLYGFVYFSTYCRNNCSFCYYRRENGKPPRYRKSKEEIVATAVKLRDSGVHLIDLTTGEDPYYVHKPERFAEIVKEVKEATGLPVMVSPGVFPDDGIQLLARAGADWYALYQETHSRDLYERLRLNQSYERRMEAKAYAGSLGMLVEEGLLTGIGDRNEDRIHSFRQMREIKASQVRVMTYVPQEGAPLKGEGLQGFDRELITIALLRLLFPDALIPASLDVEGIAGLEKRLQAGANVVTSIIPPKDGYAGVANSVRDVDEGYRTVEGIQDTLKACGLVNARQEDYGEWVGNRKAKGFNL